MPYVTIIWIVDKRFLISHCHDFHQYISYKIHEFAFTQVRIYHDLTTGEKLNVFAGICGHTEETLHIERSVAGHMKGYLAPRLFDLAYLETG